MLFTAFIFSLPPASVSSHPHPFGRSRTDISQTHVSFSVLTYLLGLMRSCVLVPGGPRSDRHPGEKGCVPAALRRGLGVFPPGRDGRRGRGSGEIEICRLRGKVRENMWLNNL